jgi:hypothetical protein
MHLDKKTKNLGVPDPEFESARSRSLRRFSRSSSSACCRSY